MEDLLAARSQMALSLAFHIIFACVGIAMPFFMMLAHWRWLRRGEDVDLRLTKMWSKGVAIFFATGAVSGTALSFELGLLWPEFMKHAGPIIGMPFSWEGTAFFLEAIALGIFLYGWGRVNRWVHWASGVLVGVAGVASGFFIMCANAWMNSPAGFRWENGQAYDIDPWSAMFNSAALSQGIHMTIAAFEATGFAVAGLHAVMLLRHPASQLHRRALRISLAFGAIAALVQPLSGHFSGEDVAKRQPIKLAAMEAHFETEAGASLVIGGIPNERDGTVDYAIKIPYALSILAHGDPNAEVKGLNDYPRELWPPVTITHYAFQVMVGCGMLMLALGLYFLASLRWKPENITKTAFLKLLALSTPLGFIAVESGWVVTELGRQPWIIYGIMKTRDAVTKMPGLVYPFVLFSSVYLILTFVICWIMLRQVRAATAQEEAIDAL